MEVDADLGEKAASRGLAAQRRLVITAVHSSVVALDTADGRQVWQHRQLTVSGRAQADQSDGTLCVTGKQLSAFDLVSGKKLWSTDSPKLPHGNPAFWSSPTVDGPILYATEVIFPVQINIRTGKTTGWIYTGLLDCDAGSPLVPQGSALWSVASDEKQAAVRALDLSTDPQPTWMFPVLENPDRYWLSGDGNRVFVLDGTSLSALPVF